MKHNHHDCRPRPCCRDPRHGWILGVCAGIARYFEWPLWLTRACVFLLGWVFTLPVIIGYVLAGLLLPEPRRLGWHEDRHGRWRHDGR